MKSESYKTFRGTDGNLYIDNPKVIFPAHLRKKRWRIPIFNKVERRKKHTPTYYVSTKRLVRLFGGELRSVRGLLSRHRVEYQLRLTNNRRHAKYWNYTEAKSLLLKREEARNCVPEGYVPMAVATKMLGVVRSFIYKLAMKGQVRQCYVKLPSSHGVRHRRFYHAGDLEYVKNNILKGKK